MGATAPSKSAPPTAAAVYRRREPTITALYPIVQHHLESFLALADSRGDPVPPWVEDDFRVYLRCGILAHGLARAQTLRRRMLRLFRRRDLLDESTVANLLTWQAAGGFSVDASVRISGSDHAGRERLLRYCARPPFALERLRIERALPARAAGGRSSGTGDIRHVLYQPSRPTPDGRTLLVLSPLEFLAAVARLIPPPRVHRHRYHGVLAPNAGLRDRVIALGRVVPETSPQTQTGRADPDPPTPAPSSARSGWARLLARIYEVFPLRCRDCGAEMRILAFLMDPFTVAGILRHPGSSPGQALGLPATAPPLTPARSPPPEDPAYDADPFLDLDQTPAFDPTDPDPIPDHDFDQTHGA